MSWMTIIIFIRKAHEIGHSSGKTTLFEPLIAPVKKKQEKIGMHVYFPVLLIISLTI